MIGQAIRASAWKWAAVVCAVLAVASMGAAGIQTIRMSSAQTAIANMARQSVAEQFATSEAYRAEEWMRARYIAGTSAAYEEGKARAKAAADGIVADVRAGRYVLRESLRCPASPAAEATAGPGVSDGSAAPRGGVDGEDVQFLVRFAGDAELVSEQLRACQAVIRADRVQIK